MVLYRLLIRYTVILFLLFCGSLTGLRGQTMGVVVVSGGTVQFQFNSYQKIKDGISYPNYSRVKIYSINGNPACKGWTLYCKSTNSTILSDDGVSTLPLNYVKVTPHIESNDFPVYPTVYPGFILSASDDKIAESTSIGALYDGKRAILVLDIAFATSSGLIDVKSGYYYVDLFFTIVENL